MSGWSQRGEGRNRDGVAASGSAAVGAAGRRLRPRFWAALGSLLALAVTLGAAFAAGTPNNARWLLLGLLAAAWLVFPAAVWLVVRTPPTQAVPLILAGAVLVQLIAVGWPPRSTDDLYRYAWDGRVQAAGIDPYQYVPVDPGLSHLATTGCSRPTAETGHRSARS